MSIGIKLFSNCEVRPGEDWSEVELCSKFVVGSCWLVNIHSDHGRRPKEKTETAEGREILDTADSCFNSSRSSKAPLEHVQPVTDSCHWSSVGFVYRLTESLGSEATTASWSISHASTSDTAESGGHDISFKSLCDFSGSSTNTSITGLQSNVGGGAGCVRNSNDYGSEQATDTTTSCGGCHCHGRV